MTRTGAGPGSRQAGLQCVCLGRRVRVRGDVLGIAVVEIARTAEPAFALAERTFALAGPTSAHCGLGPLGVRRSRDMGGWEAALALRVRVHSQQQVCQVTAAPRPCAARPTGVLHFLLTCMSQACPSEYRVHRLGNADLKLMLTG
jgi:hypothetical protein